jgi:NADH/NAD ratio-sensing transcriptional regulator Rex
VRKDINHLGEIGPSPTGYPVNALLELLRNGLAAEDSPRACVVGMNWLGRGLVGAEADELAGLQIVVGFDTNVNRLELTHGRVDLFPLYEVQNICPRLGVTVALVADAGSTPEATVRRLESGGIRGILNFTTHPLSGSENLVIIDVEILDELRRLAALMRQTQQQQEST